VNINEQSNVIPPNRGKERRMMGPDRQLTDDDREEILRLVLTEAGGGDVEGELSAYPVKSRSTFRKAAYEAGLVTTKGLDRGSEEIRFEKPAQLSERGKRRLSELNDRASKRGEAEG
jgi:hypothetical protein